EDEEEENGVAEGGRKEKRESEEGRDSSSSCPGSAHVTCGGGTAVSPEEMEKAAEAIGYSAVKYFDLKQNRQTDYKFSFDRMLDPKGEMT
ncbi:arginyl-trna synthetase family protein, partial [Cystoisospora suis]